MTTFTLTKDEDSDISYAKLKKLQVSFSKFQEKMEALRPLEKKVMEANEVIEEYLAKLHVLGEKFEKEFGEHSDVLEVNGDYIYFGDYPQTAIANTFNFWIPSSMSC